MVKPFLIASETKVITYKIFKFSGGEIQVRINDKVHLESHLTIWADLGSSDDIMSLFLLTDALRRHGAGQISLVMPYLPYARQDRVCAPGESLSLKVFCNMINIQNYTTVTVWDVHSDVALALLNRVICKHQSEFVKGIGLPETTHIVAPDNGAMKKIFTVAKATGMQVIRADKVRDPFTGEILRTTILDFVPQNVELLIVDDICDGGRTFLELAKVLRTKTRMPINLYVTHGIFSKGLDIFEGVFDKIYCPNIFANITDHKLLKRVY